jgi:hypothetical protein
MTQEELEALLPPDTLVCNCASPECRRLLFSRLTYATAAAFLARLDAVVPLPPPPVAGRICGRPYCSACLEPNGRARTPPAPESVPSAAGVAVEWTGEDATPPEENVP